MEANISQESVPRKKLLSVCFQIVNCNMLFTTVLTIAGIYYLFFGVMTWWVIIGGFIAFGLNLFGCLIVAFFVSKDTTVAEFHSAPTIVNVSTNRVVQRGYAFIYNRGKGSVLLHFFCGLIVTILIVVIIFIILEDSSLTVTEAEPPFYIGYTILAFVIGVIGFSCVFFIPYCCCERCFIGNDPEHR